VYLFSPHLLTIQEHFIPLDPAGDWKRRLRQIDRTELFDSFTQYSQKFSKVFGFKSEKALSLFAHTVGIKVLGNLNEFIRTNMLEETDIEEEFKNCANITITFFQCIIRLKKPKSNSCFRTDSGTG
jgi:uncharacterized protein YPO0396